MKYYFTVLFCSLMIYPSIAFAYLGPGLGTGMVISILGIVAAILMLIVGVIWYPIKRLFKFIYKKIKTLKTKN